MYTTFDDGDIHNSFQSTEFLQVRSSIRKFIEQRNVTVASSEFIEKSTLVRDKNNDSVVSLTDLFERRCEQELSERLKSNPQASMEHSSLKSVLSSSTLSSFSLSRTSSLNSPFVRTGSGPIIKSDSQKTTFVRVDSNRKLLFGKSSSAKARVVRSLSAPRPAPTKSVFTRSASAASPRRSISARTAVFPRSASSKAPVFSRATSGRPPVSERSSSAKTPLIQRSTSGKVPKIERSTSGRIAAMARTASASDVPSLRLSLEQNTLPRSNPSVSAPELERIPSARNDVFGRRTSTARTNTNLMRRSVSIASTAVPVSSNRSSIFSEAEIEFEMNRKLENKSLSKMADDCMLKAQDSYRSLARKSSQFIENSGEKMKDATANLGQCTVKAVAIPAIIIMDILGFFLDRPEKPKGKTKAALKKKKEQAKRAAHKAAKDAKKSAKHFRDCSVQAMLVPAIVLLDMVGSIFGR